jgi:hypothetical protein
VIGFGYSINRATFWLSGDGREILKKLKIEKSVINKDTNKKLINSIKIIFLFIYYIGKID